MYQAVLIDDERHCLDRLQHLLESGFRDQVQVAGSFSGLEESLPILTAGGADLVFLDVELGSRSGFDLLREVPPTGFEVIFTTAFEKYAVQAFRCSAVDYLLKPIGMPELAAAMQKVQTRFTAEEKIRRYEALLHNLQHLPDSNKKIGIPTVSGLEFVAVGDIIRCEAQVNYTTIFLKDRKKITVARTLKEFEELLEPYQFFRIHQSHLINLLYVQRFHKGKGGWVAMADQSVIEVATRRKDAFLQKMAVL
jgi:two-component system, LytTR family, response regulator